jgi:ribose transport system substrate-binding protein
MNVIPKGLAIAAASLVAAFALGACGSSDKSSSTATSASTSSAAASTAAAPAADTTATTTPASGDSQFVDYMKTLAPPNFQPPSKKYKVVFLDASTVLPQQKSLEVGAQDAAKKYGIDLEVLDAGGFQNVSKQVSQFETALGEKPDAIMILPSSPVAFNAQIKQAEEQGIKVLPTLIPPPNAKFDYSLADDLPLDAAKSVDSLAQALGDKGNLYAILGGAGTTVADLFQQGMEAELKKHPNLKVVYSKSLPGYTISDAQKAAESALVSQPDVDGIITNDTILGIGASKALAAQGKNVPIAGIGPGDQQTIQALKDGKISIGATPPFYAVGYNTVLWASHLLDGGTVDKPVTTVPPMILTKDNIGNAISSGALFQVLAPSAVGCGPGQDKDC